MDAGELEDCDDGGDETAAVDDATQDYGEDGRSLEETGTIKGGRGRGAPGGPLAVPGFVSGFISVLDFSESCGELLRAVKTKLDCPSIRDDDIDISVDDLKIMTDAMLVEKALAEVLKGQDALIRTGPISSGDCRNEKQQIDVLQDESFQSTQLFLPSSDTSIGQEEPGALVSGNSQVEFNFSVPPKTGKKRGRPFDRDMRAALLMDGMDARRKAALARLKQERDVARKTAPLISLRAKIDRETLYTRDQRPLRTLKFLNSILKTPKLASKEQFEPMADGEVLLTIEIFNNIKRHLKTQEFIVRGSQPLSALKDQIYCLTDTVAEKANLKVPSSYFLIEDTFYNDMRNPNAIDYSLPIRKWVREKAEAIEKWKAVGGTDFPKRTWSSAACSQKSTSPPVFLAEKMSDICFKNLNCRLGAQFLYCHQGDCKHTVVIRDMRLVHPEDVQNSAAYPVLRYVHKLRHRKCAICCIYQASKVTWGDKLAPENPCFFCDNCYYFLHYSNDGNLLYTGFQVHDYYHDQV